MVLTLDGYTATPTQTVTVSDSPVPNTPSSVSATGFNMTSDDPSLGSFVAWCLDISHVLMSIGNSQTYTETNTPFSNSYGLTATARKRVQALFDANYANVDFTIGDEAAAWQMALWEAAYEDDNTGLSLSTGAFEASSSGSDTLASTFLAAAESHIASGGAQKYALTFLEVGGDSRRSQTSGQNLVTATAIPLPATALMLLSGVFGLGAVARRRRNAA